MSHLLSARIAFRLQAGLSLLELISSVSILSATLAVGVPAFNSIISQMNLNSDAAVIRHALSMAKNAALTRNVRVSICRWDGNNSCAGKALNGDQIWSDGILLFTDRDNDREIDSESEILGIYPFSKRTQIKWNQGDCVAFWPDGSAAGYNGTFDLQAATFNRQLVLSRVGRVRSSSKD